MEKFLSHQKETESSVEVLGWKTSYFQSVLKPKYFKTHTLKQIF